MSYAKNRRVTKRHRRLCAHFGHVLTGVTLRTGRLRWYMPSVVVRPDPLPSRLTVAWPGSNAPMASGTAYPTCARCGYVREPRT